MRVLKLAKPDKRRNVSDRYYLENINDNNKSLRVLRWVLENGKWQ